MTEADDSRGLDHDLSIRFICGNYTESKVILCRCPIPAKTRGAFFDGKNLVRSNPFEFYLIYGDRVLASRSDDLPLDWRDPLDLLSATYNRLDKGVLGQIPLVGPALESFLPDARWRYELWYDITINDAGLCNYNIQIGPSRNSKIRNKCEGTCQL